MASNSSSPAAAAVTNSSEAEKGFERVAEGMQIGPDGWPIIKTFGTDAEGHITWQIGDDKPEAEPDQSASSGPGMSTDGGSAHIGLIIGISVGVFVAIVIAALCIGARRRRAMGERKKEMMMQQRELQKQQRAAAAAAAQARGYANAVNSNPDLEWVQPQAGVKVVQQADGTWVTVVDDQPARRRSSTPSVSLASSPPRSPVRSLASSASGQGTPIASPFNGSGAGSDQPARRRCSVGSESGSSTYSNALRTPLSTPPRTPRQHPPRPSGAPEYLAGRRRSSLDYTPSNLSQAQSSPAADLYKCAAGYSSSVSHASSAPSSPSRRRVSYALPLPASAPSSPRSKKRVSHHVPAEGYKPFSSTHNGAMASLSAAAASQRRASRAESLAYTGIGYDEAEILAGECSDTETDINFTPQKKRGSRKASV